MTLRWGILGTGGIAAAQTKDLAVAGLEVVAVGSRSIESATEFAAAHGIPRAHGSYEELAADPDVDVIYVATPHPYHHPNARLALEAGKHVLVEKPFTINAAQARDLVGLAAERGLVVLEAMWTRWLPHMVRIRELIASGALGEVRTVIADHDQRTSADPAGRMLNPELGGGALLDLGIYPVSFAWDILGEPTTVAAVSTPTATGVDQQTSMLFSNAAGAHAVLTTLLDGAGPNRAAIVGTEARIELDGVWYTPTSFTVTDHRREVIERFESHIEGRGMQFQALELERLVADGRTAGDILPPEQSVGIMATLDEVRRQIGLVYPGE